MTIYEFVIKAQKLYVFVLLVVAVTLVTVYKLTNQTDFQVTIDTSTLKTFESKNLTIAVTKDRPTPRTTTRETLTNTVTKTHPTLGTKTQRIVGTIDQPTLETKTQRIVGTNNQPTF